MSTWFSTHCEDADGLAHNATQTGTLADCSMVPPWSRMHVFTGLPVADAGGWIDWLQRHGVAAAIAVPGWVAVDDVNYRVYVDTIVWRPAIVRPFWLSDANKPPRVVLTIQLEGKALSFPWPTVNDTSRGNWA